jgi:hypothetical protein
MYPSHTINSHDYSLPADFFGQTFQELGVYPKLSAGTFFRGVPKSRRTNDDLSRSKAYQFPRLVNGSDTAAKAALGYAEQRLDYFEVIAQAHGRIKINDRNFAVTIKFSGQFQGIIP